jgi:hypothetical protein
MEGKITLPMRGSGITHQFEQSRLLGYFVDGRREIFCPGGTE